MPRGDLAFRHSHIVAGTFSVPATGLRGRAAQRMRSVIGKVHRLGLVIRRWIYLGPARCIRRDLRLRHVFWPTVLVDVDEPVDLECDRHFRIFAHQGVPCVGVGFAGDAFEHRVLRTGDSQHTLRGQFVCFRRSLRPAARGTCRALYRPLHRSHLLHPVAPVVPVVPVVPPPVPPPGDEPFVVEADMTTGSSIKRPVEVPFSAAAEPIRSRKFVTQFFCRSLKTAITATLVCPTFALVDCAYDNC